MPKKRSEIIFPKRLATMRDVALFSDWCGIEFHFVLRQKPPKPKKRGRTWFQRITEGEETVSPKKTSKPTRKEIDRLVAEGNANLAWARRNRQWERR